MADRPISKMNPMAKAFLRRCRRGGVGGRGAALLNTIFAKLRRLGSKTRRHNGRVTISVTIITNMTIGPSDQSLSLALYNNGSLVAPGHSPFPYPRAGWRGAPIENPDFYQNKYGK